MRAPTKDEDRRGFLDPPRWMDGGLSALAATIIAMFAIVAGAGLVLLPMLVAGGRMPSVWLLYGVGLAGMLILFLVLYSRTVARTDVHSALKDEPPDRVFAVGLVERGGWLRRYLEPAVNARVVLADDHFRVNFRRPINQLFLMSLGFFVALNLKHVGLHIPREVCVVGMSACLGAYIWSTSRVHDLRFPWPEVISVSRGGHRFHVQVRDAAHPDGILFAARDDYQAPLAELFRQHTLFHDEDEDGRSRSASPAPH